MQNITTLKYRGDPLSKIGEGNSIVADLGLRFLFFVIIYIVILLKLISWDSLNNNIFFCVYSLLITVYIFSRFVIAHFHKSIPIDLSYRPSVSFVVPAKNEGDNIRKTLLCFDGVDYPKSK